jgi:predicted site-specific integrase-resolvase
MLTDFSQERMERFTGRELSRILGVSHVTLYNWIKRGKIPEPREGPKKRKYWTRDDVIAIQAEKPVRRYVESYGRAAGPEVRHRLHMEAE